MLFRSLTKKISFDSVIFIEKKTVESLLWAKNDFLWAKKNASTPPFQLDEKTEENLFAKLLRL